VKRGGQVSREGRQTEKKRDAGTTHQGMITEEVNPRGNKGGTVGEMGGEEDEMAVEKKRKISPHRVGKEREEWVLAIRNTQEVSPMRDEKEVSAERVGEWRGPRMIRETR